MASPRDIVVVGAGIVGCAIAYELARRGASVDVVDDRAPGMGATQASAGVLAPFIEARDEGPLLELTARSLELFDEFMSRVRSDSQSAVAYQRTGTLDVALDADSLAILQRTHERLSARRLEANLLDGAAVRRCEPHLSVSAVGGLLIPTHGFVVASELTRALAAGARAHGRDVSRSWAGHTRHSGRRRAPGAHRGHRLRKPFGPMPLFLRPAAGRAPFQSRASATDVPVRPIRGQLLHLQWSGAQQLRRILWSERCYIVPWQNGTVLVGATEEDAGFDERTTLAGIQDLIEAACELVPHAWTASLLAAKVGLRPATPDHIPIIGWSRAIPNLMYATGHYRNGILLAPLTAELVASAVLDGRADPMLELTSPQRFGEL